ncbi:MAG: hypothetical protein HC847_28035 [Hydrococcus sp. RU_2_2]|nr:hypothetical protein [Hydrococcus sp. RU_2_2]
MTKYIWECCRLLGANSENAIASMQKSFWLTSIFCWLTLPVLAEPTNLTVQRQAPIHAIASNTSQTFVPAFKKKRHNNNIWLGFDENQLNKLTIKLNRKSESFNSNEWITINSFSAAYVTWNEREIGMDEREKKRELERYFDYEDTPLNEFYRLSYETTNSFQTGKFKHENTVGLDLIKNPFTLSRENIRTSSPRKIPSPFLESDFFSKKNYLSFYIGHGIELTDRLSFYFEGTLDLVIPDTTDLPDLPIVSPQEYNRHLRNRNNFDKILITMNFANPK